MNNLPPFRNGVRVVHYWRGYRVDIDHPMNGFDVPESLWGDDVAVGQLAAQHGVSLECVRRAG